VLLAGGSEAPRDPQLPPLEPQLPPRQPKNALELSVITPTALTATTAASKLFLNVICFVPPSFLETKNFKTISDGNPLIADSRSRIPARLHNSSNLGKIVRV